MTSHISSEMTSRMVRAFSRAQYRDDRRDTGDRSSQVK
jgi:hypothetical protein